MPPTSFVRKSEFKARLRLGNSKFHTEMNAGRIPAPDTWLGPRSPVWTEATVEATIKNYLAGAQANRDATVAPSINATAGSWSSRPLLVMILWRRKSMTVLKDSAWRRRFRVNPLADLFPMMTPEELADTAADIKINGLEIPIVVRPVDGDPEVLDGRNRLEALELAGVALREPDVKEVELNDDEARAFIISANIRRRHLTPGEVADLLVKLAKIEVEKETGSREPVSNSGGRGKKSALKEKVHKLNEALPEKVSESTVKRAIAKTKPPPKVTSKAIDEPKEKQREFTKTPLPHKPKHLEAHTGLDEIRRLLRGSNSDLELVVEALEIDYQIARRIYDCAIVRRRDAGNGADVAEKEGMQQ